MARIVVVGAGAMGGAMACTAVRQGHQVVLVGTHLDTNIVNLTVNTGIHPILKCRFTPHVQIHPVSELPAALASPPDLLIVGVSSAGIEWVGLQLALLLAKPCPILMITKGLAATNGTIRVLPDLLAELLAGSSAEGAPICAIGGPAIAAEQAAGQPTAVVLAGTKTGTVAQIQALLDGDDYTITPSPDLIGVEIAAAFKNLYAIAVGAAAGLGTGSPTGQGEVFHNRAASTFARSLQEMATIIKALGGDPASAFGLAGAGDLYVTAQAGRNMRLGRLLGAGVPCSTACATHMQNETIEGVELARAVAPTLRAIIDKRLGGGAIPLTCHILAAICEDQQIFDRQQQRRM